MVRVEVSRWTGRDFVNDKDARIEWLESLLRSADMVFDAYGYDTGLTRQIKRALSGKQPFDPPEKP